MESGRGGGCIQAFGEEDGSRAAHVKLSTQDNDKSRRSFPRVELRAWLVAAVQACVMQIEAHFNEIRSGGCIV